MSKEANSDVEKGPLPAKRTSLVVFRPVTPELTEVAYQWHRGFTSGDQLVYGRRRHEFYELVDDQSVFAAIDQDGDVLGLGYYHFAEEHNAWEIGGLTVARQLRGRKFGNLLSRVIVGHIVYDRRPYDCGQGIIARVHKENDAPLPILGAHQAFTKEEGGMNVPSSALPGVPTNEEGRVVGDKFTLEKAVALAQLIYWIAEWQDRMVDGTPARVVLNNGVTLAQWNQRFQEQAAESSEAILSAE
jgi:hypothetical protein